MVTFPDSLPHNDRGKSRILDAEGLLGGISEVWAIKQMDIEQKGKSNYPNNLDFPNLPPEITR